MRFLSFLSLFFYLFLLSQCANEAAKKDDFFHSFDQVKIAFTDEGNGEAVLLLHGFIASGNSWDKAKIKQTLLDKGYRVIVPDMRGNGLSDKPHKPEAYAFDAEVKDLLKLADYLKLENYTAIGYSRGSIVLAKLLTKEKRITKAVMGGMGLDFSNPQWDRRIMFADAFGGKVPLNKITEGAVNYAKSIGADLKVLSLLQEYQPVTSKKELNAIPIQVLVIAGDTDKDNGDPAALQKELFNGELKIVSGDHNNTYKSEVFSDAVLEFVERH